MGKQNKAIIAGGAGFIGSQVADALIKKNYQVVIIDDLSAGYRKNVNPKAEFHELDIRKPKVKDIFKTFKPDYVFHYAAQINLRRSIEDPMFDAEVNICGSLNLIKNASDYKVKKFIFASSGGAISGFEGTAPKEAGEYRPHSAYGVAKLAIEKYLHYYQYKFGLDFVALRFANVYGPRQNAKGEAGIVAIIANNILSNKSVIIHGSGKQTRDFVFVRDIVSANLKALNQQVRGVYNIGTGHETSINDIYNTIAKFLACNKKPAYHLKADYGEDRSVLNCTKAKKEMNWQPEFSLEQGIQQTVNWFVSHQD